MGPGNAEKRGETPRLRGCERLRVPLSSLYVEHYDHGSWVIPSDQVVDTTNDTITFTTDGFSPFVLAEVPEPCTIVLLGIGAVSLLAYAWRKRANAS
jgi:hypothetical protein